MEGYIKLTALSDDECGQLFKSGSKGCQVETRLRGVSRADKATIVNAVMSALHYDAIDRALLAAIMMDAANKLHESMEINMDLPKEV